MDEYIVVIKISSMSLFLSKFNYNNSEYTENIDKAIHYVLRKDFEEVMRDITLIKENPELLFDYNYLLSMNSPKTTLPLDTKPVPPFVELIRYEDYIG